MALDPAQIREAQEFGKRGMIRSAFNMAALVAVAVVGMEFGPVMAFGAGMLALGTTLVTRAMAEDDANRTIDKVPPHLRDEMAKLTSRPEDATHSKRISGVRSILFGLGGAAVFEKILSSPRAGFAGAFLGLLAAEAVDFNFYHRKIQMRAAVEPVAPAAQPAGAQASGLSKYMPNIFK